MLNEDIMKKILIIVPSRSSNGTRTTNIAELRESWISTTTGNSDLLIGLDQDDQHHYERLEGVLYDVNERLRMVGTLNLLATKYCNKYEYIAFLGDDHRFRTKGWEDIFLEFSKNMKCNIFYGNDLLQGANIPTAVFMSSNIIKTLGFMVPKTFIHMYADNFWLETGRHLGILKYFNNIIIEHMHPAANKANSDQQYIEVDSFTNQDKLSFIKYMNTDFINDIQKIKKEILDV